MKYIDDGSNGCIIMLNELEESILQDVFFKVYYYDKPAAEFTNEEEKIASEFRLLLG